MNKKLLFLLLLCFFIKTSFAQLSSKHYLPPLKQTSGGSNTATHQSNAAIVQQAIYLSTPEAAAFPVNVYRGISTTPWLTIPSLSNGAPYTIDSGDGLANSNNNITLVTNVNTGAVLINSGLRFEAPGGQQFYVNYRGRSGAQAGSLTCKGEQALGTEFRWGGIANKHTSINSSTSLGIMGTVDGTTVTISGYDANCAFRDGIQPYGLTDDVITIPLNAGETFVLEAVRNQTGTNANPVADLANIDGWLGAKITSTQPIAIANGGLNVGINSASQARDVGIDQPVPTNILGKEYVFIRGNGDANDNTEFPIIVAISNGTQVFANGVLIDTIDDGEYVEIPGSNYSGNSAGANMYVTTSKDAYAFQCLAGQVNRIQTIGMNFIAPVNCLLPDSMSEIPQIQRIAGANSNVSALTIIASVLTDDGDVEIYQNGVQIATPASTAVLEGGSATDWKSFYVSGLSGEISVVTPGPIAVGTFMSLGSNAGLAGYFSGFDTVPEVEVDITGGGCFPGSSLQETSGSFFAYEWYHDGNIVTDSDGNPATFDPTLTGVGDYFVRVTDFGGCTYDSAIISFFSCDPEIQIIKVDDADPIDAGTNVSFTITAQSFSVNEVTNFVITDVLPSEFDFVSATPGTGTTFSYPDWTIGTIQPGEKFSLDIVARAKDDASGTVTNTVTYNFDGIASETNAITDDLSEDVTITPCNTASAPSSTPDICINDTLTDITHNTTIATGIGTPINLPAGVTASWSNDVITISGTPTVTGTYNYSIPLTGGCNTVSALGTIVVNDLPIANDITGHNEVCINDTITLTEGTNGTIIWTSSDNSVATIDVSGIVTGISSGTTNISYTITDINGCTSASSNPFTVTVNPLPTITSLTTNTDICEAENAEFYISGIPNAEVTYNINGNANETTILDALGDGTVIFSNATSNITINLISIENTTTGCSSLLTDTATVTVNVFPTLLDYFNLIECYDGSNTQEFDANDAVTLNPNTTVVWYDAESGGNVVANPIVNTPTPPTDAPTSFYAEIEDSNTGCINPDRVEIQLQIVNPPFPDLFSEVCSNEALSIGLSFEVTYTVTSSDAANVPPGPSRTTASIANISDTYTNTTANPVTITYITTIADGSACDGEVFNIEAIVYPESNGGDISDDQVICTGDTPSDIIITNSIGDIINWERSESASFSAINTISETSTTLAGTTIGPLTETTYFRALIQSGNCTTTYSPVSVVNIDVTSPTISGTLPELSEEGCLASNAPTAVTTVAELEALGLTVSDDFNDDADLNVSHVDNASGTCPIVVTRVYTVSDACNNSMDIEQTITITIPTFTISDADGSSTVDCIADATETFTMPTITDACGDTLTPSAAVITENPDPLTCEGTRTYTYTYTDCAGNSDTWAYIYTIEMPQFTITDPDGASTVSCVADATETFTLPNVTDFCGTTLDPYQIVINENPNPATCEGTITYVYTYKDCVGQTANWLYVYTIDTPQFTITDADGASTVNCIADATETFTLPTVTDVCGNTLSPSAAVITENPDPLTCEGTRTYTYTYTDCANNTANWSYVYTIDTPQFTIADANGVSTVDCITDATETFTLPTVTDMCGNTLSPSAAVITENPDPLTCEGTRTYTYTYTDCANNTANWSYVYTIDTPQFTIADVDGASTVDCIADATETFTLPTVTDVCGNTLSPSAAVITENPDPLTCEGTRTYTYTYTDCANNTANWAYVYTIDTPQFTIADADGAETVDCIADATETFTLPTVTDVCGNTLTPSAAVITENPDPLTCEGTRTYTYTYTDCAGNTDTWAFIYTIDTPQFTIADADGAETVDCIADATETFTLPTVTDVCGNTLSPSAAVITENPDPLTCEGTRTYTYTYTDCANNTANWSYVYTIDTPQFTIADVDGASTVDCIADATETFTLPTVTDVCGNTLSPSAAVITENPDPLTCEGTRTYTYTYTDCANNTANWAYVYTIDTPQFTIADADGAETVDCIADATETFTLPTVTDVCGNTLTPSAAVITENPDPLTCEGTRTYTYTYTDCAGNTDTWAFIYTIDTPQFNIQNPNDTSTIECLAEAIQPTAPTVIDVCGNNITPVITENNNPVCEGNKIYTFTYTDCAGNTQDYIYTYIIDYTINPVVPANESSNINSIDDAVQPDAPVVLDNCGANITAVITESADPVCDGQKTYTFTYVDCAGNTSVYTYTYNIDVTSTLDIENTSAIACSDVALNYDLTNLTSLSGVTFEWIVTPNANLTGPADGNGTIINDILTNISGASQDVLYTVTPYNTDGCMGNTFELIITVNPEPYNATEPSDVTCSNVAINHDLNSDVDLSDSTFSWVAADNTNVTGETSTPATTSTITDVLINTSGTVQTVVYTITPTSADGCQGNPYTYTVTVSPETELVVEKVALSAADGNYDTVGETIEYEITVENSNEVEISNVTLTDTNADSITPASVASIPAFGSTTFIVTHEITQADLDAGEVINSASVSAIDPCGTSVNAISDDPSTANPNDSTVTPLIQTPSLSLLKEVVFNDENGDGVPQENETLTYIFTVENTGNVTVTDIAISDPLVTVNGGPIDLIPNALDSTSFSATYTITQANIDAGSITNSATVSGNAPNGNPVTDTSDDPNDTTDNDVDGDGDPDDSTIFTLIESPELTVFKTGVFIDANNDGFAQAGETIAYTFNIINTGNITISNITITDAIVTVTGGPIALAPTENDNTTFTATYTLTQDDVDNGSVTNVATASGNTPGGTSVTDDSDDPSTTDNNDATITELTQNAKISLLKTAVFNDENGNGFPEVNETISYMFTVQNTGNTTITGITITDPMVTVNGGPVDLEPNEIDTTTFIATYSLTLADINSGSVSNSATVSGQDSNGDSISDISDDPANTTNEDLNGDGNPDDATVTTLAPNPQMSLEKTGVFVDENGDGITQVGETINYTFSVSNTGNVTISNITITDAIVTVNGGPINLNPNEIDTTTFTASYSITQDDIDAGSISNTATVNGEAPLGNSVSDTSDDPNNPDDIDNNGDGEPDDNTITSLPNSGGITLTKATLPATDGSYNTLNEVISYELVITNTGNVTLTNITVTDANADSGSITPALISNLAPGESVIVNASHTITQTDLNSGEVNNTASVTGEDPFGNAITDTSDDPNNPTDNDADGDGDPDDITTTSIDQAPAMELEKVSVFNDENGDGIPQTGETITYNFTVVNTGNVVISNISISDPLVTVNGGPINLAPSEINNNTFYAVYTITLADINSGSITNSATVNGEDPSGNAVSDTSDDPNDTTNNDTNGDGDPDDNTVTTLISNPELTLSKTGIFIDANGDGLAQEGETIQYIFDVANTGNVTINNITVSDPIVAVSGGPISLNPNQTDSSTFTAIYVLTQDDVDNGFVENVATTSGNAPNGDIVTDTSDDPTTTTNNDETITSLLREPQLTLLKIGTFNDENGDGIPQTGETISYVFILRNTGNVTLFDVVVTDPIVTVLGNAIDLAPAQVDNTTFSAIYTIQQEDIDSGNLTNTAIATGTDVDGTVVTDISDFSDDPDNPINEDLNGDGDPDDPTVTSLLGNPELSLEKIGVFNDENGDGITQVNETITYTFIVTNSGNMTITGINITDPLVTVSGGPIDLAPLDTDNSTFTATYSITQFDIDSGNVTNTATVTGQDPNGNSITDNSDDPNNTNDVDDNNDGNPDDDTVTTLPGIGRLEITKEALAATDGSYDTVGEVIVYTLVVENTGNVTLTNLVITDDNADAGSISPSNITILSPGDTITVFATHTLTQEDIDAGSVTNSAVVNANAPNGDSVSDVSDDPNNPTDNDTNGNGNGDDDTITAINQSPSISLTKATDLAPDGLWDSLGEVITYTIVVTNTGNVTLTNINITDANADLGSVMPSVIASLNLGESVTVTANHTIIQDDLDAGFVENTAVVTTQDPNGDLVSDDSDDPNNPTDSDTNGDGDPDDVTVTSLQQTTALDIIKTVDSSTYENIGDVLTYTITVTNSGSVTLLNVIVTDPLATITGPASISILSPGESFVTIAEYIITAEDIDTMRVENTAYATGTVINTSITLYEDSDDSTNDTNIDIDNDGDFEDPTVSIFAGLSDLSITNVVDNSNPAVGDLVTFTITITNEGSVTATNIIVEDLLPSGYEFESFVSTLGLYDDFNGEWTIPELNGGDVHMLEIVATVLGFGDYLNIATISSIEGGMDSNLANNSDTAIVNAECYFVYNEFTPNGDGINETLHIDCIERHPNNTLEIYNRWGYIVYRKKGYTNANGWDGTSNGRAIIEKHKKLPVGTYFYVLDLKDNSKPKTGWIYINR
ncbi:hypothetical protein GCM10022291_05930 [Postechiella marina]|uniref:Uncharacterized protein n=1 Tax=Postechiella marina TaxID=943941 RepID=A0ABP8C1V3_9FLAO